LVFICYDKANDKKVTGEKNFFMSTEKTDSTLEVAMKNRNPCGCPNDIIIWQISRRSYGTLLTSA
jgi:hypothetical protein